MKTTLKLTTLLLLSLTFSCSKDDSVTKEPEPVTNVYAVGAIWDGITNPIATIWKNGVGTPLSNAANPAAGYAVFVTDNGDEYVAGKDGNAAVIWKNGIKTTLTDGTNNTHVTSIFVSGNDVYVSGYEKISSGYSVATVWKNGTKSDLSDGLYYAEANSVFVSGNDVYVAGFDHIHYPGNLNPTQVACVWKNGIRITLPDNPALSKQSTAYSVFVSGNDVYVAGTERNSNNIDVARLWKNGVVTTLSNGLFNASAYSVTASGNDIYIVGNDGNAVVLWKNNLPPVSISSDAYAQSLFVLGDDVYIGGREDNKAKIWKNGVATDFNGGDALSVITSVFVTKN